MKNFIKFAAFLALLAPNTGLAQIWEPVQGVPLNSLSIGINPKNPRTVWFGTPSSSLYVSYDGGKRVSRIVQIPFQITSSYYTNVFIHPVDTSVDKLGRQ